MTATAAMNDKLARARDLMRQSNPSGDLAVVVDRALDALLEKLEKQRLGKTKRPQRKRRPSKPGQVASAVRREVFERDGEQCTFVDAQDRRCPSRTLLELDHIQARARGGTDEPANLRVRCRPHNRLHAEEDFGREHVERQIHLRQRRCNPPQPQPQPPTPQNEAAFEVLTRGLVGLGFRSAEASRAVRAVLGRHSDPVPLPELLREALSVLTG